MKCLALQKIMFCQRLLLTWIKLLMGFRVGDWVLLSMFTCNVHQKMSDITTGYCSKQTWRWQAKIYLGGSQSRTYIMFGPILCKLTFERLITGKLHRLDQCFLVWTSLTAFKEAFLKAAVLDICAKSKNIYWIKICSFL